MRIFRRISDLHSFALLAVLFNALVVPRVNAFLNCAISFSISLAFLSIKFIV